MRLFFGILLSAICLSSFAQVSFGIKAGANFNSITNVDDWYGGYSHSNTGFHLGALTQINIVGNLSVIAEIQFSRRGDTFPRFRQNLNYVDLPVALSLAIKKFSIQSGISAGYLISAAPNKNNSASRYLNTLFENKLDCGLIVGAQYNITEKISVVSRYYLGLSPVIDDDLRDLDGQPLGHLTAYARSFQLSVAYKITGVDN